MRNRHDVDIVVTNPVHDVVREPVHMQLPAGSSRRARHADLGMSSNRIDRFSLGRREDANLAASMTP
jgi:hypothetical protein